jgi:hypothetical protein
MVENVAEAISEPKEHIQRSQTANSQYSRRGEIRMSPKECWSLPTGRIA